MGFAQLEMQDDEENLVYKCHWVDAWAYGDYSKMAFNDNSGNLYNSGMGTTYNDFTGKLMQGVAPTKCKVDLIPPYYPMVTLQK